MSLLARQASSNADVVLGLFPTDRPQKVGMVDFNAEGRVHSVIEKPSQSDWRYCWGVAVWTPVFTHFMHEYLATIEADRWHNDPDNHPKKQRELPLGDVIQAGIDRGLRVEAEVFTDGEYLLDIGTPEDLVRAVRKFANQEI